jgi:hypothetical protein
LLLSSDVDHLQDLILIDASLQPGLDESLIVMIAKFRFEQFIGEFAALREGACSQLPLPVAKAMKGLELLERADFLVKSFSKRL